MPWLTTLGVGAGYYNTSELTGAGYGYWQLGISRQFGLLDLDLRFHDTNRGVPIISAGARADSRLALSARIHF